MVVLLRIFQSNQLHLIRLHRYDIILLINNIKNKTNSLIYIIPFPSPLLSMCTDYFESLSCCSKCSDINS